MKNYLLISLEGSSKPKVKLKRPHPVWLQKIIAFYEKHFYILGAR